MSSNSLPPWNERLHELLQRYIEKTPPKTLGRLIRNFFLINISALETVPPGWEEDVLHIIALLDLIDDAEDGQ